MTKYCKNCKWYKPDRSFFHFLILPPMWLLFSILKHDSQRFAKCQNTRVLRWLRSPDEESLVTGRTPTNDDLCYCTTARKYAEECGPDAKFFEPRRAK